MPSWRYRELVLSAVIAALALSQLGAAVNERAVQLMMFRFGLGLILLSFALRPGLFFRRLTLREFLFDGSRTAMAAWLLSMLGNLCLVAAALASGFGLLTL